MRKTSVYFPDRLSDALRRAAKRTGRSEAELIREGVARMVSDIERPTPTLPLFASGDPRLADRAEELLSSFGER